LFGSFQVGALIVEHAGLNDLLVNVELVTRTLEHAFLDRVLGDEAEDAHFVALTDAMSAILCLHIALWVPVTVKDDDRIGGLEVGAEASGLGAEHKDVVDRVGLVELVDQHLTVLGVTDDLEEAVAAHREVLAEDAQQVGHLTEDQDLVVGGLELGQHAIEEVELARRAHEVLILDVVLVEQQIRVIAHLAQVHVGVVEALEAALGRETRHRAVIENQAVEAALVGRHLALDDPLDLVRQLDHFLLEAAQQERPNDLVQTLDQQQLGLLLEASFLRVDRREWCREPLLKVLGRVEDVGQEKVE